MRDSSFARPGLGLAVAATLLLSGCADAPRWGAWSQRPTSGEIATVLRATPYEAYTYPSQPNPALAGRPAAPGSGRAAATSPTRPPPRLDITVDDPKPGTTEATAAEEPSSVEPGPDESQAP